MLVALTRAVPPSIARCELTHLQRAPIDYARADAQHRAYQLALVGAGCRLVEMPPTPDLPDSVFVEDTAIVLDEVAVVTRPGASSRRPETVSSAETLARYRPIATIEAPGTLEGGDVLRIGSRLFVGASSRTNADGISQLSAQVRAFGYQVAAVPLHGCLHLKSAATLVGPETVLANPAWVDPMQFGPIAVIEVEPTETFAANALLVGDRVLYPAAYQRTRERLEARGITVVPVDVSELAKAEGGVTCCSVVFEE